jgi:hypothetical protein
MSITIMRVVASIMAADMRARALHHVMVALLLLVGLLFWFDLWEVLSNL